MKEEYLNCLNRLYNQYSNDIVAICKGGSSVIPFIQNPHDIDVVIFTNNLEIKKDIFKSIKELINSDIDGFFNELDILVRDVNYIEKLSKAEVFVDWAYQLYFMHEAYFGDNTQVPNVNILNNYEKCKEFLLYSLNLKLQAYDCRPEKMCSAKWWYHYAIQLFILLNKSYNFNNDQIVLINKLHDKLGTCEDIEYLRNISNEL